MKTERQMAEAADFAARREGKPTVSPSKRDQNQCAPSDHEKGQNRLYLDAI